MVTVHRFGFMSKKRNKSTLPPIKFPHDGPLHHILLSQDDESAKNPYPMGVTEALELLERQENDNAETKGDSVFSNATHQALNGVLSSSATLKSQLSCLRSFKSDLIVLMLFSTTFPIPFLLRCCRMVSSVFSSPG